MFSKLPPLLWVTILVMLFSGCESPDPQTPEEKQILVCKEGSADFKTIQAAVDAVETGSTIAVCPGIYAENLRIAEKSLTLYSQQGPAETIIEASAAGSVITVSNVAAPGVTIEGFSIRGGNNAGGSGGGIWCRNAAVILLNNAISNNSARNGGGLGASECNLEMQGNRMFDNQAVRRGGGAFIVTCEGTVEENEIYNNKAQEGGGLAVVSTGFRDRLDNRLTGENVSLSQAKPLILEQARQWFQQDDAGSGPSVTASENEGLVVVKSNIVRENSATPRQMTQYNIKESGGGGIWIGGDARIIENVVQENKSSINGGGIYVVNANAVIEGNRIIGNHTGEDGGGLCINTCAGRIVDNLFTENSSLDDAGGMRVYFGIDMEIENNTISRNEAVDASGGVKLSHSKNIFRNNILEENQADTAGGLELDNDATIVEACTFKGNIARLGAAIHSKAAEQELIMRDSVFEENIASEYGGALHFEHNAHPVILSGIEARNNQARKGGFIATNNSRLELTDATLTGNSAVEAGGALFLSGYEELLKDEATSIPIEVTTNEADPKLIKLRWIRMEENSAEKGGAMFVRENTLLDAANLVVTANSADENGGGLCLITADGLLANVVIDRNTAPKAAGILLEESGDLEVRNCVITDNGDGEGVLVSGSFCSMWQYNNVYNNRNGDYSGVTPPTGTNGNISKAPLFVNAAASDYYFRPDSPCIDSGDPAAAFTDEDGSRADMGAYGGPDGLWNSSF